MEKTLLDEFKKYEKMRKGEFEIIDSENLSPTVATLLICNDGLKLNNLKTVRCIKSDEKRMY